MLRPDYRRLFEARMLFVTTPSDDAYLDILTRPIRICAAYKPTFGQGANAGLDIAAFQTLYRADPFYSWFGLDNPLMYAAHKAAGGMTSVYRQIGIGCERLFQRILRDQLGLSEADVKWSYTTIGANKKKRELALDGRISLDKLGDEHRAKVKAWMDAVCNALGVSKKITASLIGAVFEVRQGYKSADAKRQNADIANAATAYTQAYLPCAVILSTQIAGTIATRYRNEKWSLLVGNTADESPVTSTYAFMRDVVGYDLAAFFERNRKALHKEVDNVLNKLLSPDT